jgi:hypothetical protein
MQRSSSMLVDLLFLSGMAKAKRGAQKQANKHLDPRHVSQKQSGWWLDGTVAGWVR